MTAHLIMSRQSESLGGLILSARQTSSEELNPFEMEVVSKFDSILAVLHELEEMFSHARQEVLKKSAFEGKESGKICAIKGRVITNRKRYFRSLEGEIQNLDRVFQEQWSRVSRDFTSLKAASGLEEKTGAELTPNKDFAIATPIINAHPPEVHGHEMVSSSPFVKSVALPSLKKVEAGKKPISMKISTPLTMARPLLKASSTTEIEIPRKIDFEHQIESTAIPNPCGSRLPCRGQQVEVLQIPEDVEEEEITKGAVSRVRLGLLNEIKSTSSGAVPTTTKSVRMIKGHGFKIAQAVSMRDQHNGSPFENNDKCTI